MSSTTDASRLEALRVAQAELSSGDTSGNVFVQLSPGSAMFLVARSAAQEEVASEIRQVLLGEDFKESK